MIKHKVASRYHVSKNCCKTILFLNRKSYFAQWIVLQNGFSFKTNENLHVL